MNLLKIACFSFSRSLLDICLMLNSTSTSSYFTFSNNGKVAKVTSNSRSLLSLSLESLISTPSI
ncbi:hypothetical protein ONA01_02925 [Mycoplasmopsis cynos]|nr:hypothetical protein [Mycoplasmopsis cynos]WAM05086.1 hypothetical protein ONA01_02925 [Mycoplasmopsis cynos]